MTAKNSKLVTQFLSLSHMATIKLAFPLYDDFDRETVDAAFAEIQRKEGPRVIRDARYNRAKDIVLTIHEDFRERILLAVHGMHAAARHWQLEYADVFRLAGGRCYFRWRSDGSIDTIETVKKIMRYRDVCKGNKFEIACMYSLQPNTINLWKLARARCEEQASRRDNWMMRFCVSWLKEELSEWVLIWKDAVATYLQPPDKVNCLTMNARVSCFFGLLTPEKRWAFLHAALAAKDDDFRYCLYAMTPKEQNEVLRIDALAVLRRYLKWPLQSLFLATVEKLWDYIDDKRFDILLFTLHFYIVDQMKKDFDYKRLFIDFWGMSPPDLQRSARENQKISRIIDTHVPVSQN